MERLIDIILHTDDALLALVAENVNKAYMFLFLIILLETGLIIFPFLPGDGLLFSAGVVAASTQMEIEVLVPLLIIAAISGNLINYLLGKLFGNNFRKSKNRFINKISTKYEPKTEQFYQKYGGMAILTGRFFPIIRTYIPFFAGAIQMPFMVFLKYTVFGAMAWVLLFCLTGYWVGEIEWVKNNYGLIFVFLLIPLSFPFLYAGFRKIVSRK